MAIKTRGQFGMHGDTLQLQVLFRGPDGAPIDLDTFPGISIQQPSGNVLFDFTTNGVYRVDTGLYGYDFVIEPFATFGVWEDNWRGTLGGGLIFQTLNFVVQNTQQPAMNTDGYVHLGDEVPFNFTQTAIKNINKILAILRARLNSSGKAYVKDEFGNEELVDCDIYTIPQLVLFIIAALDAFNMIPHFTEFTFEDTDFFGMFGEIIVRFALIYALSSKALIERGREFQINDNGVTFQPPGVSDILMTQYSSEYQHWESDIRLIKQNMKPGPAGLGTLRPLAASPQYLRLRHLRSRRIY
jgi:hypothetical protein